MGPGLSYRAPLGDGLSPCMAPHVSVLPGPPWPTPPSAWHVPGLTGLFSSLPSPQSPDEIPTGTVTEPTQNTTLPEHSTRLLSKLPCQLNSFFPILRVSC